MHRYTRKNNHNKTEKNHNGLIIIGLIHANWCGHCQALKPEWKKMKYNIMKSPSRSSYRFMEIEDSDKAKDYKINVINSKLKGGKLEVNGFPTIFKVSGGSLDYFDGGRDAKSMENWFLKAGSKKESNVEKTEPTFLQRIFGGKTKKNKTKRNKTK